MPGVPVPGYCVLNLIAVLFTHQPITSSKLTSVPAVGVVLATAFADPVIPGTPVEVNLPQNVSVSLVVVAPVSVQSVIQTSVL